jgi:hypothetical protein
VAAAAQQVRIHPRHGSAVPRLEGVVGRERDLQPPTPPVSAACSVTWLDLPVAPRTSLGRCAGRPDPDRPRTVAASESLEDARIIGHASDRHGPSVSRLTTIVYTDGPAVSETHDRRRPDRRDDPAFGPGLRRVHRIRRLVVPSPSLRLRPHRLLRLLAVSTMHHAADARHRYIRSFEPDEDWFWDYVDEAAGGVPISPPEHHPLDQPTPGPASHPIGSATSTDPVRAARPTSRPNGSRRFAGVRGIVAVATTSPTRPGLMRVRDR